MFKLIKSEKSERSNCVKNEQSVSVNFFYQTRSSFCRFYPRGFFEKENKVIISWKNKTFCCYISFYFKVCMCALSDLNNSKKFEIWNRFFNSPSFVLCIKLFAAVYLNQNKVLDKIKWKHENIKVTFIWKKKFKVSNGKAIRYNST